MIATLTGTNSFQLKNQLAKMTDAFVSEHGELALEKLDGEEAEYEKILGAIESLPFLASKKMVVVQGLSFNKTAAEAIEQLVERAGDTTDLIIVEPKPDKRAAYYKQLKKLTDFKEYNEMDDSQLASWLAAEAKSRQAVLSSSDARYLVERVGTGQMRLNRELEKLVLYDPKISRQTIDLLTDESPTGTIFNLIDSVFSGNLQQALNMYEDQRKQKVEPQAIHGMLVWQMHAVAIAVSVPSGANPAQAASDSGLSPFVFQKSQRIARRMGRQKVIEFMQLLRDIDYRGKHEVLDYDEALRYAIISLAQ
jgi:DNA polymerase-3 subunit delta